MEHDNPKRTSYVDDILVIPPDPSIAASQSGIYAATFGGIIHRPDQLSNWQHQTLEHTYDDVGSLMQYHGGAIPYSCLRYDEVNGILYAGSGRARHPSSSHYDEPYYPVDGTTDHYSLWSRDLTDPNSEWSSIDNIVGTSGNIGQVWQIDIVDVGTDGPRLVVAASSGVYIQNLLRSGWNRIWDSEGGPVTNWPGVSTRAWAVAVGAQGRIYVITHRTEDEDERPTIKYADPTNGVYPVLFSGWKDDDLLPGSMVLPGGTNSLLDIMQNCDLYTLKVVPAAVRDEEQIFVGMYSSNAYPYEYSGYFRFGPYVDEFGDEDVGWVNFIYQNTLGGNEAAYWTYHYVDYLTDATDPIDFDPGWVRQFPTKSTIPLAIHPNNPDRMFAAAYHIPLFAANVTHPDSLWTQRYCENDGSGFFNSFGIEEMSPRSIGFTKPEDSGPGRLILGCGDFQAFLGSDEMGTAFMDMDPFVSGDSEGREIHTIGEEIYALRGAAGRWGDAYDYDEIEPMPARGERSRQRHVIAKYDSTQTRHWEFVSQDFDNFPGVPTDPTTRYDVSDIEIVGHDTMFASICWQDASDTWSSILARGTRSVARPDWAWEPWWIPAADGSENGAKMVAIESIPGRSTLLVADKVHQHVITALRTDAPAYQAGAVWMDRAAIFVHVGGNEAHRLFGATKNIKAMVCDDSGRWLYLANKGQDTTGSDVYFCANVTRLAIPEYGAIPGVEAWELLLNTEIDGVTAEGIAFPAADAEYYPNGWDNSAAGVAESLPVISAVAVHPDNPRRIFIGVRCTTPAVDESFHPNNGVYEFDPVTSMWSRVAANGLGDPCHGVNTMAFVPSDPGKMIVGVYGQGFFRIEGIERSSVPVVAAEALDPLSPMQTVLQLEVASASTGAIDSVAVDGEALGLSGDIDLNDSGLDGDVTAADGIWSANVTGASMDPGVRIVPVVARDTLWNTFRGRVNVFVITDDVPVVDETLLEPLHVEQSLLMLKVASATSAPIDSVAVILGDGWPQDVIVLNDDGPGAEGLGFDSAAGDTVWTGQLTGDLPAVGSYPVTAYASDADGNVFYGTVVAGVIDEPAIYFKNVSGKTDLHEPGMPTGVAALDLVPLSGGDYGRDVYIGRFDDSSTPEPEGGLIAEQRGFNGDVPKYNVQNNRFYTGVPSPAHGPAASADLDNDGLMDLVIPSGTASEGLLFYRQTTAGMFQKMDSWKPIVTTANTHSWAAACADYDGDGMLDIYLCRASVNSSGILPRPSHANPLADVLLKNDLLNSGKFIDVSTEIYEGSGGSPLSSRSAVWADFDDDGDPDLAVADAATGEGFRIYRNDPANANGRLSRYFDLDNAVNVSDVAWIDYDGNGDLELLATTFHGSGSQGEAKIYDHNAFATGDPFTLDLALPAPPPHWSSGVRVADLNLDGHPDFVMLPDRPTGFSDAECIVVPALNTGDGSFGTPVSGLGLSTFSGAANGGFLSDLNGDGAPELFLGRKQDDFRFFGTTQGADLGTNWRRVKLVATRECGSAPAVGAKVTFETGNGAQGSVGFSISAEGRDDHAITIGFAPGAAPVCNICWPNGAVEVGVALIPADTTLVQPNDFTFNTLTTSGTAELKPDGLLDLVFRWSTDWQTDPASDKVTITGGTYTPTVTTLMAGVAGVTVRQWPETRNGTRVVWHEVRLANQLCENGYLLFDAESADHGTPQAVLDQRLDLTLCTSKPPNIGNPPGDGGL